MANILMKFFDQVNGALLTFTKESLNPSYLLMQYITLSELHVTLHQIRL